MSASSSAAAPSGPSPAQLAGVRRHLGKSTIPVATTASYAIIAIILAVAVFGTSPNFLGASIVGPPAFGFLVADKTNGLIQHDVIRWTAKMMTCNDGDAQQNPAFEASNGASNDCPTPTSIILTILGLGLVLPMLALFGTQFGTGYFPAKLACTSHLNWRMMLTAATIPMGAMALWGLIMVFFWIQVFGSMSFKPDKIGKTLSSLISIVANPLFVFGYLLACSAAATLMVLQHPCERPTTVQDTIIDESLSALNKPAAKSPTYTHAH